MFENIKEKKRIQKEEEERKLREEKNKLLALSEKELLIEILYEMKEIEKRIDSLEGVIALSNYKIND